MAGDSVTPVISDGTFLGYVLAWSDAVYPAHDLVSMDIAGRPNTQLGRRDALWKLASWPSHPSAGAFAARLPIPQATIISEGGGLTPDQAAARALRWIKAREMRRSDRTAWAIMNQVSKTRSLIQFPAMSQKDALYEMLDQSISDFERATMTERMSYSSQAVSIDETR